MGFQILDANGEAMSIPKLDKEIAAFWGVELDKKWYASPPPKDNSYQSKSENINWFDYLGWKIQEKKLETIEQLEDEMLKPFKELLEFDKITNRQEQIEVIKKELHKMKYYFDLTADWKAKNYSVKSVED